MRVPLGTNILLFITSSFDSAAAVADLFQFDSANDYFYTHHIATLKDYIVTDRLVRKGQSSTTSFNFNLQTLVPSLYIIGDKNVGVTIIGE